MNRMQYLNTILTVLALLLALNLWTAWSAAPSAVHEAHAVGIPDSGAQRQQMIDLLKKINQQQIETIDLLHSGEARVRVILPEDN